MSGSKKIDSAGPYGPRNATRREPAIIDGESGRPVPAPRKRAKHIKLEKVRDVRNELARLYRQTKAGEIPPEVASRLTFMLGTLGRLIVDSELEARIAALEQSTVNGEEL